MNVTPVENEPIRVVLVTPSGAIRAGLRVLLAADERIEIVAEAPTLDLLQGLPPTGDVLITTTGAARNPEWFTRYLAGVGVLFLAVDGEALLPRPEVFNHNAWGVVSLDSDAGTVCAAVRAIYEGLLVGSPGLLAGIFSKNQPPIAGEGDGESLTPRENEVLQQLALGLTNKQIALVLGISEHTVKYHISAIYAKLGVLNRADAVRVGVRQGWIGI